MNIYILAQNPKTENNIESPLAKTKSEQRLNDWLDQTLDDNVLYIIRYGNSSESLDKAEVTCQDEVRISKDIFDFEADRVIALGNVAAKTLTKLGISHFKCEHPSGLNRNLNDQQHVQSMLKKLKEYIKNGN